MGPREFMRNGIVIVTFLVFPNKKVKEWGINLTAHNVDFDDQVLQNNPLLAFDDICERLLLSWAGKLVTAVCPKDVLCLMMF